MKKTGIIIVAALAIGLLLHPYVVTESDEYTLIKQFGKVETVISSPGIAFKTPFIQTVQKIPKKKMVYDIDPSDVTTKIRRL